jgi:two-component system OmpR family sensor kinase
VSSLRTRLLAWTGAGLAAGLVLATVVVGVRARESAGELLDYQMAKIAAAVPPRAFGPMPAPRLEGLDVDEDVVIQIWDPSGLRVYGSHEHPTLPGLARPGFSDVRGAQGAWRVYAVPVGGSVVQVSQPLAARGRLARRTAFDAVVPMLALFPLLGVLLWIGLGRGLAPLRRLADGAQARGAHALQPFDETGLDTEIRPLVGALNALLGRLGDALDAQRGFVADAAHALRSPLAALTLQAQLARRADDPESRRAALDDLARGLKRANRLVAQLLTLAREESGPAATHGRPDPHSATGLPSRIDLTGLAREALIDAAVAAQARGVDLGLALGEPLAVEGDPDALRILIDNLLDNAIRHGPPGSRVDLSVGADGRLAVEDRGPGLPVQELERVFERFHRAPGAIGPGSGLGLAIVRRIADRHGATVTLANRDGGGLRAELHIAPAGAARDGAAATPPPGHA